MPPTIDIDMFDDTPHVGDKVKVTGKIKSIDEDSGEVDVSYDDVSIVGKDKSPKKRSNKPDYFDETVTTTDEQMNPNMQTLDQALANSSAFQNNQ